MRFTLLSFAVSLWWGCGASSSVETDDCPVVTGTFRTHATLESAQGACGVAKKASTDSVTFDSSGRFLSPVGDLASCSTRQLGCGVHVHCSTELLNARGDFQGLLALDGESMSGRATLSGNYNGCTEVAYSVELTR